MASPCADPLALAHKAVCAGIYGNIQWKDSAARLVRDDPDMVGFTPEGIRAQLRRFVEQGGRFSLRQEQRAEYLEQELQFWFRAIIAVPQFRRGLFVEVILVDDDPEEPFVEIVSAHPQL